MILDSNVIAVIVSAAVGFGIGWAWYSDYLFGKVWRREMQVSDEDMAAAKAAGIKGMQKQMILGFLGTLVMAYILARFLELVSARAVSDALLLSFWLWLGFIATVMMGIVLWERRSWTLYALNAGYWLVALLVMSTILTLWV